MTDKLNDQEAEECVRKLLAYLGDDPEREGLLDTPRRVLGAIKEHFRGYEEDPEAHLSRTFTEVEGYDELVLISDIEIYSHCEHHVVPFVGKAHVAYIPNGKVVGLRRSPASWTRLPRGSRSKRSSPPRSPMRSMRLWRRKGQPSSCSVSTFACVIAASASLDPGRRPAV